MVSCKAWKCLTIIKHPYLLIAIIAIVLLGLSYFASVCILACVTAFLDGQGFAEHHFSRDIKTNVTLHFSVPN